MSTATFLKSDTATAGTWYSGSTPVYGSDGYGLPDPNNKLGANNPKWPSYAAVTIGGDTLYSWSDSTSNTNALEYPPPGTSNGSDTKRIWSVWYSATNFTIDINDGSLHQVALYFSCGDSSARTVQVQITDDDNNNAVLDTRSVSIPASGAGTWMVWTVSGKVTFHASLTSGSNAIVNGVFFDPAPSSAVFPPLVSRPRFEPAHYE